MSENCNMNIDKNAEVQLQQLFSACDREGKGYIVKEELQELCVSLGISFDDAEALFTDLDADKDGKISFVDFSSGFEEFLNPETKSIQKERGHRRRASIWTVNSELSQLNESRPCDDEEEEDTFSDDIEEANKHFLAERKRRESVYQAWTSLTSSLVDSNLLSLSQESQSQIRQLYKDLDCKTTPKHVVSKVETVFSSIIKEMEELQKQKKKLEDLYKKEKTNHIESLKSLEDEIDDQVSKVEERALIKAKMESEEEKRAMQEQLDKEMAEMQAHLKIFKKVDGWLKKDQTGDDDRLTELNKRLEDAYHESRSLKMSLHDTLSNLALLRTDLAQSRSQYEDKCRELHDEREQVLEYMHQYEHLRRQMDLLHNANQKLQDTNDNLREKTELNWNSPPYSRASSARSSLRRLQRRSMSPPCQRSEVDEIFSVGKLLDDLDSGLSTLPDKPNGCSRQISLDSMNNHGPSSLEQEIKELMEKSTMSEINHSLSDSYLPLNTNGDLQNESASAETLTNSPIAPSVLAANRMYQKPEEFGTPDRTYKVVLAGNAYVGKTTFIYRLCQGIFVSNLASTLGVDYKVKTMKIDGKTIVLQLWDTAGQERYRAITKSYFRRADGVLLFYDITSEQSFTDIRHWTQSIEDSCKGSLPMVICGTKADLRDQFVTEKRKIVSTDAGEKLAKECGTHFFETSSQTGQNVEESIKELAK